MNTLLPSAGEISLSLWDLHPSGGLPIIESLYEEVVPNVTKLTGTYDKGKRFLPKLVSIYSMPFISYEKGSVIIGVYP